MTLRSRMIDFPKHRSRKLPLQLGTEWIETRAEYDDLGNPVSKCGAYQLTDTSLSQGIMQQNSRNRDALDQLRDRPKPGLLNNFQQQTRLRRMILQDVST